MPYIHSAKQRDPIVIILNKISEPALSEILNKHHRDETRSFLSSLDNFKRPKIAQKRVDLTLILELVGDYRKCCDAKTAQLPAHENERVDAFFDSVWHDMNDLVIDSYTLDRTSFLITTLQDFIKETAAKSVKEDYVKTQSAGHLASKGGSPIHTKRVTSSSEGKNDSPIYTKRVIPSEAKEELEVANKLLSSCLHIQSLVGSPETQPGGLIIDFMMDLCKATDSFQSIYERCNRINPKLQDLIQSEIKQLREEHPHLAKAAENLHNSYSKHTVSKK
jgi:hypothetical protein